MSKRQVLVDRFQLCADMKENHKGKFASQTPALKGVLYENLKDDFGNTILKKVGENTVTIGGAIAALEHLTGVEANWKPQTLNEIYNIPTSVPGDPFKTRIALFGVGTGGCGLEWGSVVDKDVKLKDVPDLIPLRAGSVLTGDDASLYFMKKDNGDGSFYWYLKEMEVVPIVKTCWKDSADDEEDGTEVTEDISDSTREEGLETLAEYIIDFNTKDVREYYESIGALNQARWNSLGLYMGDKVQQADGSYEYANVRLFSYLNLDNKSVRIKTASQYTYKILSLT